MSTAAETIIEPERPIIDCHHHLWDQPRAMLRDLPYPAHGFSRMLRERARYLLDEYMVDAGSGHDIRASVFIECGSMYRAKAQQAWRSLGETEFANGMAAMAASGVYGQTRACAGLVGHVDLRLGAGAAKEVLEAHIAAGGGRFRGIRQSASFDADASVLGPLSARGVPPGLYRDRAFRDGFACLQPLGLSFDAWLLEPQLDDLLDLARAFPETPIVLDHVGSPVGIGAYAGQRDARFAGWRERMRSLAACDNVAVKLGGLGMPFPGFEWSYEHRPATEALAHAWAPYIETCIEAFGVTRCMFESNFPVDHFTCDYATLWNAFKQVVADYSEADKQALFFDTANRTYRLDLAA